MFFSITTYNFFSTGSKLQRAFHLYFSLFHSGLFTQHADLTEPCQGNFRKFQGSGKSRFGGSEKDRYFGCYIMYYYGIYDGDNNGSIIYILSSMFYVLDMLTKIY